MSNFSAYKSEFLLNPDIIFLNHGSFGATPQPVFSVYQDWQRKLENQPVEFLGRDSNQLLYQSRTELANYLHCNPSNLVFVPNTTVGLNIISRSLTLEPGDVVLSTNHEYGAINRMWKFFSEKSGFFYRKVNIHAPYPSDEEIIELFLDYLTPDVKIIFLSHITSATALLLPVVEICKIAKQKGIITIIDGAHVPGQYDLNLQDCDCDFYVGNLHKWLCAPKGSAFLYTAPAKQHLIEPLVVSWGYQPDQLVESPFVDLLQWTGTRDLSAYLSVPAAIKYQSQRNWDEVRSICHFKAVQLGTDFQNLLQKSSLYTHSEQYIQMFSIDLPPRVDIQTMKTRLYDEFHIEVPLVEWSEKKLMRISLQAYNSDSDCQRLLQAVKSILEI